MAFDYMHPPEDFEYLGEWCKAWRDPATGDWTISQLLDGLETEQIILSGEEVRELARLAAQHDPTDYELEYGELRRPMFATPAENETAVNAIEGSGRQTGAHPRRRSPAPAGAVLMGGYWWGVLTPFAIVLGILLLWLAGSLFGAIVSWAWKKAHYGLLKKGWIAEDYDEDSREWTTRPGAERLAAALTRSGEYRMLPCFGWIILIVRDHKNEKHDEKRN